MAGRERGLRSEGHAVEGGCQGGKEGGELRRDGHSEVVMGGGEGGARQGGEVRWGEVMQKSIV